MEKASADLKPTMENLPSWSLQARADGDETVSRMARTVLVADGNKTHRASVAEMLTGQGYSVVLAASSEEAMLRIKAGGIALLVSAISMSGMDGFELLRALRNSLPDFPVIIVASGMFEIDWICLKGASLLGAAAAYTQPLASSVFLDSVRQLLEQVSR
jgi:CheY-like chemotaxis protein